MRAESLILTALSLLAMCSGWLQSATSFDGNIVAGPPTDPSIAAKANFASNGESDCLNYGIRCEDPPKRESESLCRFWFKPTGQSAELGRENWDLHRAAELAGVLNFSDSTGIAALLCGTFPAADLMRPGPSLSLFWRTAGDGYESDSILNDAASEMTSYADSADFALHSPVVDEGATLPRRFTCDGTANTLPLAWSDEPPGTKSFAIIMHTVAPDGIRWYWLVWDIPATVHELQENMTGIGTLGSNSIDDHGGYAPPCSRGPGAKTYTYTLYALASAPQLSGQPRSVTRDDLLRAISDRTLGFAVLNVTYSRPSNAVSSDHSQKDR